MQALLVMGAALAFGGLLYLYFERTISGKALKASAINPVGARIVGISTARTGTIAYTLGSLLGAISGLLIGPMATLYYDSGFLIGLKAFIGAIIGGMASYPLTAVGAILVGVLESFASFWSSTLKDTIVFLGADPDPRLAVAREPPPRERGRGGGDRVSPAVHRLLIGLAVVLLALVPLGASAFAITLMNYIGIGAIVALGLVLLTGIGGLTSFGQAAFAGIGAYASAWLSTSMGMSPWLGLMLALVTTGAAALAIGAITLRLGGHFLPLSTIAWGIAIYSLFANIPGLGQHDGIANIPPIAIGPVSLAANGAIYYLIWGLLGLAMWLVTNLLDSREGRTVRSLRGGQTMLGSLGISMFRQRLVIFVIAALLAAVSGWLFAHMSRFISPSPFEVRPVSSIC